MAFPTHIVAGAGYVEDGRGNTLLVRTYSRGWDCTGGQIEIGESIEDGVLREVLEESGAIASVRALIGVYSNVGQRMGGDGKTLVTTKVMLDFVCDYIGGGLRGSDETSEAIWAPKARVLEYVTAPAMRYRFGQYLGFDGRVRYASYVTAPEFRLLSERYV